MKKTIEELWNSYLYERTAMMSEEERAVVKKLAEEDEKLRSELTEEQEKVYEECRRCFHEISDIYTKRAFSCGVNFATNYLFEALNL